jgi:hypothetical protein
MLFTVVIPAIINLALDFSPIARAPNIVITQVGLTLSGLFIIVGLYLTARAVLNEQGVNIFAIILATVIASFPAMVFLLSFLMFTVS